MRSKAEMGALAQSILDECKKSGRATPLAEIIACIHITAAGENRKKQLEHIQRAFRLLKHAMALDILAKVAEVGLPRHVAAKLALEELDKGEKVKKQIALISEVELNDAH